MLELKTMQLSIGQTVQRKDLTGDRWSLPFEIKTPEQLNYHQSFQSMDYEYRLSTYIK